MASRNSFNSYSHNVEENNHATIDNLDEYLDMLYQVSGKSYNDNDDGIQIQLFATAMILELCLDVMNLEQLIQNNTLMGALSRVLQDEHKKSIELSFNILRIFLAFSNFMELHPILANYKVGVLTVKVIEYELKRYETYELELTNMDSKYDNDISNYKLRLLQQHSNSQRSSSNNDMVTSMLKEYTAKVLKLKAKDISKLKGMKRKQEKLLFISFYILRNLASDIHVERKMLKKNLLQFLIVTLEFQYVDLVILNLLFLLKITLYEDSKDQIKEHPSVTFLLIKLLTSTSNIVVNTSLRLLFNLSFDEVLRDQMIKNAMIPKLISLLNTPSYRGRSLKLLYHLSVDDRVKSMISHTNDAMPILTGLVVNFPSDKLAKELAAVVVNLTFHGPNIEQMLANKGLSFLMDRLERTRDPLLAKIIRNFSLWSFQQQRNLDVEVTPVNYRLRGLWSPYIKTFLQILNECKDANNNDDFLIELLGCFANLSFHDMPSSLTWAKILTDYGFLSLISKYLVTGIAPNDMLLEIIMIISNTTAEVQVANIYASANIIPMLYQIWTEKSEDFEIKLQLIYCFYKLILHQSSREEVLYGTRIVVDIIDCLTSKLASIRQQANIFCESVIEFDRDEKGKIGKLSGQIIKKRFESYNRKWFDSLQVYDSQSSFQAGRREYNKDEFMSMGLRSYEYDSFNDYGNFYGNRK